MSHKTVNSSIASFIQSLMFSQIWLSLVACYFHGQLRSVLFMHLQIVFLTLPYKLICHFFLFLLNMRVKSLPTSGNLTCVSLTAHYYRQTYHSKNLCFHYLFSLININRERERERNLFLLMSFLKINDVNLVSTKTRCC